MSSGKRKKICDDNESVPGNFVVGDTIDSASCSVSSRQVARRGVLQCENYMNRSSASKLHPIICGSASSGAGGGSSLHPALEVQLSQPSYLTTGMTAASSEHCETSFALAMAGQHLPLYDFPVPVEPEGVSLFYRNIGDCSCVCSHCNAVFWCEEKLKSYFKDKQPHYHRCCENGRVRLLTEKDPFLLVKELLNSVHFMENIRAYNQMFSMTSFGAHVDESINNGKGPYVFKVSGQIYHWIGSLCPTDGTCPRFLQLYIYDTDHEVVNRLSHFGGEESSRLSSSVVSQLISLFDTHNELVKLFRTARDKCDEGAVSSLKIRLFSVKSSRQYELPTSQALGAIVFDDGPRSEGDCDVIIEMKGGTPRRVNKLHPSYMSLQFPVIFVFGKADFHPHMMLKNISADGNKKLKKLSMNMYYSYQLHDRMSLYSLLLRAGRLFQQYVVTAYCSIELDQMDYIKNK